MKKPLLIGPLLATLAIVGMMTRETAPVDARPLAQTEVRRPAPSRKALVSGREQAPPPRRRPPSAPRRRPPASAPPSRPGERADRDPLPRPPERTLKSGPRLAAWLLALDARTLRRLVKQRALTRYVSIVHRQLRPSTPDDQSPTIQFQQFLAQLNASLRAAMRRKEQSR